MRAGEIQGNLLLRQSAGKARRNVAKELTAWECMTKRGGFLDAELGKGWSAPFTGYSWKALQAWVGLCDAWYSSDYRNKPRIESAMREVVSTFQSSELSAVRLCIYGVGNEEAMVGLWPTIKPE